MKKFRLLLLDTNVVMELFRQGIWPQFIDLCDVHLSRTVVEQEAQFYEDDEGEKHYFDLQQDVASGKVAVFDVIPSRVQAFASQFDSTYLERLDPGEAESLAYLMGSSDPCLICSSDSIVYRILGNTQKSDRGLSLAEILEQVGLGRQLSLQFTKEWRERWTKKGFAEKLGGTGRKP